jgi:hypothetical protein
MKKSINSAQKADSGYQWKRDYSCQACHINEAVIKLVGSGWLYKIKGNFCGDCAIKKIKYWYCQDTPKNDESNLFCEDCGRYKDQQTENNRILWELETAELLKELERRMKGGD